MSPHLDYVYANNINRPEHVSIPQSQMEKENVSDTLQMDEEPSSESDDSVSSPSPLDPEYIPSDSSSDEDVVTVHAIKSSWTEIPECEESEERNFFVYEECLKSLFVKCPMCDKRIMNTTFQCRGTLLLVSYTCQAGHAGVWYSQPMVDGMAAGNLRLSCAVLFCGLTYDRVKEFLYVLSSPCISETHFYDLQNKYLYPCVHSEYSKMSEALIAACGPPEKVTVVGDARCDSPGFSAKYSTYTVMEIKSGAILDFSLKHVTQSTSSIAMEKDGCFEVLTSLEDHGLDIKVLGTDRCPGVAKLMKDQFPHINHQYDLYHVEKSVRKQLTNKASQRGNFDLHSWIKAITNHLWFCCHNCDENPAVLKEKWKSLIYHITNQHEWDFFDHVHTCDHPTLADDVSRRKKWLKPDSLSHEALKSIVLDPRVLGDLEKMYLAVHTGRLESYHALVNKYCSKRQHFSYRGMVARTCLAVLDHNNNLERSQATTSAGDLRYNTAYPKRTQEWIAKPVTTPKSYKWRLKLVTQVFNQRLHNSEAVQIPLPENIPRNIASKSKPSKMDIVQRHMSRFQ